MLIVVPKAMFGPSKADTIMRVQQELDETKVVLQKTIESGLQRGEKLEQLLERRDALISQNKNVFRAGNEAGAPYPT